MGAHRTVGETDHGREAGVGDPGGPGVERPDGVAGHVVRFEGHVAGHGHAHPHQGDPVGEAVHRPEHVHVHGHLAGQDAHLGGLARSAEEGVVHGEGLSIGEFRGSVLKSAHHHGHEPVGQHELAGTVNVFPHDPDGGVAVGVVGLLSVFVGRVGPVGCAPGGGDGAQSAEEDEESGSRSRKKGAAAPGKKKRHRVTPRPP